VVPLAAVPLVPAVSAVWKRATGWFAVFVVSASLGLSLFGALTYAGPATENIGVWLGLLNVPLQVTVDGLSVLVSVFVAFLSLLILVFSLGYMKGEAGLARYYSLVLLFVGSMLGLVMAGNLVQFYFFWELVGICSALLIAFWSDREAARRAGLKAFVVTHIGDASLLVAVLLVFATLQTTSFGALLATVGGPNLSGNVLLAVGVLVFVGAMGKSAQVPLHVWLPDAMEGPTTVSALIHAATMVNAGVYLVIRLFPLFQASSALMALVLGVGMLSAVLGGLNAFASEDIKRILAYSTISQLGLMFVALGLGSWPAATYHMVSQGLFKALAFLAAGSVIHATGTRNVEEMGGLRRTMKWTYLGFLVSVLAMSGLPPLVGFWSKDAILSAALESGWLTAAAFLMVSLLTAAYGFRALVKVFHGKPAASREGKESEAAMLVPILALSVSVAVAWLVLDAQQLVDLAAFSTPGAATALLSVSALAAGAFASYEAFLARRKWKDAVMESSGALRWLRNALLQGLGFDRAYLGLYRTVVGGLSGLASDLETGLLGTDAALVTLAVVAFALLVAGGVV
jgi:NADH-quinone oxidoreductase subunit L